MQYMCFLLKEFQAPFISREFTEAYAEVAKETVRNAVEYLTQHRPSEWLMMLLLYPAW